MYTALFVFIICKIKFFNIPGISNKTLPVLFIIKVLCGIFLALIYTYYYKQRETADIYKFFDDGKIVYGFAFSHPLDYLRIVTGIDGDAPHLKKYYDLITYWHRNFNYDLYNDYKTMIRFNAISCLFSFGYYSVNSVFMSFISFTGLAAIYKTFYPWLKDKKNELLVAVFLVPSVLLWTSGVLKEGLIMFGMGILIYSGMGLLKKFSPYNLIAFIFAIIILLYSKIYIAISVLPGLATIALLLKSGNKFSFWKFLGVHIIFLLLAFNIQYFTRYNFIHILCYKQQDFAELIKTAGNVGSVIFVPELKPAGVSLLLNSPLAFFNTLLRPAVFEAYSPVVLLSALENLLLIVVILVSICFINIKKIPNLSLFYFCISFAVITFILSGLTTPVMGALVRYRAPALPFFIILFLFLVDKEKLIRTGKRFFRRKS
ncbi:MAG: hypothetical protein HY958_04480 [Bacteroidia bacterium]|nr:hypothetical protein [Bacteroidia bacterium]